MDLLLNKVKKETDQHVVGLFLVQARITEFLAE